MVWLDAPADLLLERLTSDPTPRPLMQAPDPEARLQALLDQRRPLYAQADLRVLQTGEAPVQVAANVLEAIPSVLKRKEAPPEQPVLLQDPDGHITSSLN